MKPVTSFAQAKGYTDKIISRKTVNMLNKGSLIVGKYRYAAIGNPVALLTSANWSTTSAAFPVKPGDVVRFNLAYQNTYYVGVDENDIVRQLGANMASAGAATITVASNVKKFYATVFNANVENSMITINNELPSIYKAYYDEKVLDSKWIGKAFVSLGDSITWQDGNAYTQGNVGAIARGYQTILKEKLGFASYNNQGVSGAPMANGTANGAGTNTTGRGLTYTNYDLVVIAAGTNDFKLNVALGSKGQIGDVAFDTNTFYGAYRDLIEFILTNNPKIRIVLFTPLQRDSSGYDVNFTNTAGFKLIDYVNVITALGEMYSLPVCDMYRNSSITKLTMATFLMDGLHPNDVGYARMGDYAARITNTL